MHTKTFSALIIAFATSTSALAQSDPAPHVMPPLDRAWTAADFTMATDMITSHEAPLPIYTENGHPVMDRFLAPENLNTLRDTTRPPGERMREANAIIKADGLLYAAFLQAASKGKVVHVELSQLIAMRLHLVALQADLIGQVGAANGAPMTAEQLTPVSQYYFAIYNEVAVALDKSAGLSMGDHSVILNAAAFYYPRIDAYVDAASREQLRQKFQALHDQIKLPVDVRNLDKLVAAMTH